MFRCDVLFFFSLFHGVSVVHSKQPQAILDNLVYSQVVITCNDHNWTITLPKTNIAPTNGWLEYYFPIGEAYFQGLR